GIGMAGGIACCRSTIAKGPFYTIYRCGACIADIHCFGSCGYGIGVVGIWGRAYQCYLFTHHLFAAWGIGYSAYGIGALFGIYMQGVALFYLPAVAQLPYYTVYR